MTILVRGEWYYDLDVYPYERVFLRHVVRFRIDPARIAQVALGTWVAGGTEPTREAAQRQGIAAIDAATRPQ